VNRLLNIDVAALAMP